MGRFDERDEDLNRQSKPISDLLLYLVLGLGAGFIFGALWGLWFFGAQIEAIEVGVQGFQYAEAILSSNTQYHITLFDGITISDQTFINGQKT